MQRCKGLVCDGVSLFSALFPGGTSAVALQMIHTSQTVLMINMNNQVRMEVNSKNLVNMPAPDVHSL